MLYILVPLVFSISAACLKSVWIVGLTIVSILVLVATQPYAHKRENMWIFLFVGVCSVPINIYLLEIWCMQIVEVIVGREVSYYLGYIILILVLGSFEQIVMGILGKIIWKEQYDLSGLLKEEKEKGNVK